MRRMIYGWALMIGLVAGLGCSQSEPAQPKLTDEQIKEQMKIGKEQHSKERGGRGGPGGRPSEEQ